MCSVELLSFICMGVGWSEEMEAISLVPLGEHASYPPSRQSVEGIYNKYNEECQNHLAASVTVSVSMVTCAIMSWTTLIREGLGPSDSSSLL